VSDIRSNIEEITKRISAAAERSGRDPSEILLLAISKTMPAQPIAAAFEAGQVHFGENRVQEAREKIPGLPDGIVWHMVGHLQTNKAKYCPELFQWIHSIDSVPLAAEVARRYREKGKTCRALVQVSVSGEEAKFGCDPEETTKILSSLLEQEGVVPAGLMTMPPFDLDPETARPYFQALRDLRDTLVSEGFPEENLKELSMGMTGDFEVAVEEGATIVRIGTAIFGPRNY
jgi:pyridoxal phosphate enzyme (YggS family)